MQAMEWEMIDRVIVWHEIKANDLCDLPDADVDVLVYDEDLDDVVVASLDVIDGDVVFVDAAVGDPLPAPLWWAEKPFPQGE